MKLYFYTNKNILFDILGRNIIAPDSIVKDIKRYRTISTLSDHLLFVTHKKLNRESRERGIAEPEFVYPITLMLSDIQESDGQVVLISKSESGIVYSLAKLSDYDAQKHIGAYLIGEIPLSRIEKIYFDTEDEQDGFSRPSPDYWYPMNKYALLPKDFTDELSIELDEQAALKTIGLTADDIIEGVRNREKQRASILNFINETRNWQYNRYLFNIDSSMQQLLRLKDDDISKALPHYTEAKSNGNLEYVCLVGETQKEHQELNQKIYNAVRDTLAHQPYSNQRQPELIQEILNAVCKKTIAECDSTEEALIVQEAVTEIKDLSSDSTDKTPEEILATIPGSIDVLKALLFVAKNPNRYDLFLESLNAYHADLLTRRRAAVLWGALNGLYGMPGEGFNKDNQQLWQFIESFTYEKESRILPSLSISPPEVTVQGSTILGMTLKEECIVSAGEIRKVILSTPEEELPITFYNKLLEAAEVEAGSKKKAVSKGYAHSVASVSVPEIKKGDCLGGNLRIILEQLLKDCKTNVPNRGKLLADYVGDEKKFDFVFNLAPDYWKEMFKISSEKTNA